MECKKEVDDEIARIHQCVKDMREDHKGLHQDHKELGAELTSRLGGLEHKLNELHQSLSDLIAIFEAGKGFVRVWGWIGRTLKWVAVTAAAIGAILALFKFGGRP